MDLRISTVIKLYKSNATKKERKKEGAVWCIGEILSILILRFDIYNI
jgi:hypothetical protein